MLLKLTDPNDANVRGSLTNDDPIGDDIFAGATMNLFIDEHTSSHNAKGAVRSLRAALVLRSIHGVGPGR